MNDDGQMDLIDQIERSLKDAAARSTDPTTAHEAAASVDTARLEALVLEHLRYRGGMTTHELADVTGLQLVSISPRMKPLVRKKLIQDSGEKRPGLSGRNSIVWEALL